MGVYVFAYEHIKPIPEHLNRTDCSDHLIQYAGDFPQSVRGLEDGRCYDVFGWVVTFRAGSYGTYAWWRDELARRALGVPAETIEDVLRLDPSMPFYELLFFSNTEGAIGPDAAADLAEDFMTHRATVLSRPTADPKEEAWFTVQYDNWAEAFRHAAHCRGVVLLG